MMEKQKEWFATWFDSEFYHLLYNNRDHSEAEKFIGNLIQSLQIPAYSNVLDLGCGKGRHANQLAKNNLQVDAIDLSKESIDKATEEFGRSVRFFQGDMRDPFGLSKYDVIFNLFTSFGYFDKFEDDLRVLQNVSNALKSNGIFTQDFLNAEWVQNTLVKEETQNRGEIAFQITREIKDSHIFKNISFEHKGTMHQYQEKVKLITLPEFEKMYKKAGLKIIDVYGDFDLNPFDSLESPRLILISHKQ